LLFNSTLEYGINRIWGNQEGLKLNGIYQLLVYVYNVHILGESIHTIQKITEPSVVASKEIGLEVNADKNKHKVISRDQNEGRIHNLKTDSISSERVKQFKYLGTPMHQNCV
jgi:hypothetical protein